jgi:hypothetical protein
VSPAHTVSGCLRRCDELHISLTPHLLVVNISQQKLFLFEKTSASPRLRGKFPCSTSKFGIGQQEGSNRTPLGLHRIAEKIGDGWPVGTAFKSRQPVGFTWKGMAGAKITTRIMWLDGLEPGFNRGGNVDSHARYIYIHGTGDETTIGKPASHGCVHLAAKHLIPLYNLLPSGTLVWIC